MPGSGRHRATAGRTERAEMRETIIRRKANGGTKKRKGKASLDRESEGQVQKGYKRSPAKRKRK